MRVTNRAATRNYLRYINNALSKQQETMEQIESGHSVTKMSDDVASGVKNMRAASQLYKNDTYKNNVDGIKEHLDSVEGVMTEMKDLISKLSTDLKKAVGSSANTQESRKIYAQEFDSTKQEILQLLNTQTDDKYMFGGSNNYTAPFTTGSDGSLQYNGIPVDQIQQRTDGSCYYVDQTTQQNVDIPMNEKVYMDIGLGIRMTGSDVDPQSAFNVSYSGPDILGFGKSDTTNADGTTTTTSNNLYNLLNETEQQLLKPSIDSNTVTTIQNKLSALSSSTLLTNITDLGAKSNFLSTISSRLSDTSDTLKTKMGNLVGTDTKQAAIDEASNLAMVNALYRLGSSVIPTSLMDFIK